MNLAHIAVVEAGKATVNRRELLPDVQRDYNLTANEAKLALFQFQLVLLPSLRVYYLGTNCALL